MMNKVRIGDEVPHFMLFSSSDQEFSIKNYVGKKNIVLYFYPKDNTPGCIREACAFRDSYGIFKKMGAEVIGISSDSQEKHQEFVKKYDLPFILLSDNENKVRKKFGVPSTLGLIAGRVTYIIDKKGIVRHMFSSQFRPTKHIDEAKEVLKKLDNEQAT